MAASEKIPASVDEFLPVLSQGRLTYDMRVNVLDTDSIQRGLLDRMPQSVKDQIIGFPGQARLVIEIYQT